MSAGEIARHFDITKPSLSKHFNILRDANLIHSDREGTTIIYHLNVSVLEEALIALIDTFKLKEEK